MDTLTLDEMIEHCEDVISETANDNPSCSMQHVCLRDALLELRRRREDEKFEDHFATDFLG
tara:strand:+ start:269 stop:451 length:183 start_codon:yes stop_codon:yes gene_type:complete